MESANNLIGLMFGQYKVTPFITNEGIVDDYLARDERLEWDVAFNLLFPQHSRDTQFVERFQRQVLALDRLRHHHSINTYATGKTAWDELPVAIEYVVGRARA